VQHDRLLTCCAILAQVAAASCSSADASDGGRESIREVSRESRECVTPPKGTAGLRGGGGVR
jgi:hypothetical protein